MEALAEPSAGAAGPNSRTGLTAATNRIRTGSIPTAGGLAISATGLQVIGTVKVVVLQILCVLPWDGIGRLTHAGWASKPTAAKQLLGQFTNAQIQM